MLIQDLKDGMILELRDGKRYLLTNGMMCDFEKTTSFNSYHDNLISLYSTKYDIIRVYKVRLLTPLIINTFKDEYLDLIWERKELTDREIEVLKALKTLGLEWLARDEDGEIFLYQDKPEKDSSCWYVDSESYWQPTKKDKDLFNFIKWEDEEPTKIDDLLKGV